MASYFQYQIILIIGWKSEGLFESKLLPLQCAFSPNIKCTGYKIEMQFNSTSLVF